MNALTRAFAVAACACATALLVTACGGGGGEPSVVVGGAGTPQITSAPQALTRIVGQDAGFDVVTKADGSVQSFSWEQRADAGWIPSIGVVTSDSNASQLRIPKLTIGHHDLRYRALVQNAAGGLFTDEAALSVFWGAVDTLEPNTYGFGTGSEGFGSADGGSPGGGDGEGAGAGGGLGKTVRATISVARTADGVSLGSALTGATSGLVRIKAGPGTAPVLLTMTGGDGASYYDEGRNLMMPLPAGETLHALITDFDQHVGVTILSEAVYRYAINHFIVDPDAVRGGTTPLRRSATPEELRQLTTAQIQLAQEAIRAEINRILPARHRLDFITTLPTPVDVNSGRGAITNNRYGRMQVVIGGLALAAGQFNGTLDVPALTMTTQLADDLTDGVIDGLALDQHTVFGPPGAAYGPENLPFALEAAADEQLARFGDGSVDVPPGITAQPGSATITEGGSATLSITASGTGLSYQWRNDSGDIAGATQATYVTREAGNYRVVVSNSAATVISEIAVVNVVPAVVPASITTQPVSTTAVTGSLATFSVVASGTNLEYQWHNTAGEIQGATAASYSTGNAGTYHVVVRNSLGAVTSASATLSLTPNIVTPEISAQPVATTINAGRSATLSVTATGGELRYQWHNGSGPITNATGPSHITTTAGSYFVVVSNTAGSVTSATVTVTVIAPPTITTQPASATITEGSTHTFSVVASGTGALSYQWHDAQGPIANANAASHTTGTAGSYYVVISNESGPVTSVTVVLTLTPRVDAPLITSHPASVTINEGQSTTLSVTATGTSLTYQWRQNGNPISGATAASYPTSAAGSYSVFVSNSAGSATSNAATVTVIVPPTITSHPASVTINQGQTTTLSVTATGTSPSYQWRLNGNPISGATAGTYATSTAGSYTVVVSNTAGSVTSNAAAVNVVGVPSISSHPASVTINQGQSTTLSVTASGPSLSYQWRLNGTPISGATAAAYATGTAGSYTVVVSNSAGSVTSNAATVNVVGVPSISSHPASVTINQGQSTTLSVTATGSSPSYQWQLNGTPISGATSASYATGNAGSYRVVVSNSAGSVTSNAATVTVIVPPTITSHPASVTINQGQTTTLSVTASGTFPSYQWRLNGTPISGATASSYATGAAGSYSVVVSNTAGSVTSNAATVNVIGVPSITSHPVSVAIIQGQTATLSVTATGASLSYQWRLNGTPLSGATAASFATGNAGSYTVVVSNSAGSVTSNTATVTFVPPPTITTQPSSVAIYKGQTTTLSVTATGTSPTYQWLMNGNTITGANASSYPTGSVGTYTVVVRNAAGAVTSNAAVVSYVPPPVITSHPTSASTPQGSSHTFSVTATGRDVEYQWQQITASAGPVNILGATQPTYATGAAGTYRVIAYNPTGSTVSNNATLGYAAHDCSIRLPAPVISRGAVVEGRISLPVSNYRDFSDALFEAAPDLPACGLNDSASRTWVNIKDGKTGNYIYGFCALGRGADLQNIWVGQPSVSGVSVYVELVDRACERTVISNTVSLP